MIHKETTPFGETLVYMNGYLLYKRWPNGRSLVMEKYSFGTYDTDRDRGRYEDRQEHPASREAARLAADSLSRGKDVRLGEAPALLLCCAMELVVARHGKFSMELLKCELALGSLLDGAFGKDSSSLDRSVSGKIGEYLESLPGFDPALWQQQVDETLSFHRSVVDEITASLDAILHPTR